MEENKEVLNTSETKENIEKRHPNYFLVFVFLSLFLVVFSAFYNLYFKKDYDFLVETSCDNSIENCFYRDCSVEECPPNNLSLYKQYHMRAYDFEKCENEDCTNLCTTTNLCTQVLCSEQDIEEGLCLTPEEPSPEPEILDQIVGTLEVLEGEANLEAKIQ